MTILDVSIVNVALPSISRALDFSRENLQWVITAYSIAFGGFLLLGRPRSRPARTAPGVHGRSGALHARLARLRTCAIGGNADRRPRGAGARRARSSSPAALSIVMTSFEEGAERNKALGIWGALGGSGAAVGVLAGGMLTKYLGWEWIFFVNVPVGALVLRLGAPDRPGEQARRRRTELRRARRGAGQRRPGAVRLHDLAGARRRLGDVRGRSSC